MTSALVLSSAGPNAPALTDDLLAVGIEATLMPERTTLVQAAIEIAPDLIICFDPAPTPALFGQFSAVWTSAPRPVAMFTTDPDAEKIALAMRSGIHAYVVAGYGKHRLRSVIHLAQARFREDSQLRKELSDVQRRFDERKLLDRAKGILMGARNLREEEAYRALRSAAMATKQRIGELAQMVIDSAHYAEAVNRAGQLRMLSQRLVKLYALKCAGVSPAETERLFRDTDTQIETVLATLGRNLSHPTFGDLLASLSAPWTRLRALAGDGGRLDSLERVDALAEEMLDHSERLTANLEVPAFANALHAINVAGRQRMLSQRLAKQAVMLALLPRLQPGLLAMHDGTARELEDGLVFLRALPLTNAEITREMEATAEIWQQFKAALSMRDAAEGRERIATSSEQLLGCFDRITDQLERAIQAFT
jgi:AmiR/NasT family two-component response regulator